MKKLEPYENQMMYIVGGSRLPSTPGERELEYKCNPHPNDWIDCIYDFNKLPFSVIMQKGLVTQAEEERRKGRYGYLSDLIPSFGGSDAPYFSDMILEPIEKFDATHFHDGREKSQDGYPYYSNRLESMLSVSDSNIIRCRAYIQNTKYNHRIGNEYAHT